MSTLDYNYTSHDVDSFEASLQEAELICSEYCLDNAAYWISIRNISAYKHSEAFQPLSLYQTQYELSLPRLNRQEYSHYQLAKKAFHLRDFTHAYSLLKGYTTHKLRFLRLYSLYLMGERDRAEEMNDILGKCENPLAPNNFLLEIVDELSESDTKSELDAFSLYLYGVALLRRKQLFTAAQVLIRSVKKYPYNWSAWLELGMLLQDQTMYDQLSRLLHDQMKGNMMKNFFLAHVAIRLRLPRCVLNDAMAPLLPYFAKSPYLMTLNALAFYENKDYTQSRALFEAIRKHYPTRIKGLEIYSNLLYIQKDIQELSVLAMYCVKVDRFRPETCCILEFDQSIEWFKRALQLDRSFHWIWALLGHNYINIKNIDAAIECYHRAIKGDGADYRTCHALGQAYQLKNLDSVAVEPYERAVKIKSDDAEVWTSLMECHNILGNMEKRKHCLMMIRQCKEPEGPMAIVELARLYDKMGDIEEATQHYMKAHEHLEFEDAFAETCLYLANTFIAQKDFITAQKYITNASVLSYPYHETAQKLLKRMDSGQ
ncbi:hypothetical protein BDF14DRAFT_1879786 [Spinellus fusiger]|nr:hypothetical protein BDF14DRAFT_1879786 [Spinellus fusiger]